MYSAGPLILSVMFLPVLSSPTNYLIPNIAGDDAASLLKSLLQYYQNGCLVLLYSHASLLQNKLWNVLEKSLSDNLVPVTVLHVEDFDHSLLRFQCIHRKLVYVLLNMGTNAENSLPKLNNFKKVLSNPDLRGSTWVMFHEPTVKLDELFSDLPLPFNYEFLVASPSPGDLVVLKEVYRVEHSLPLTVSRFGSWGRGVGFLGPKNSLYERRNDFQGLLFRTANLNPPPAGEKVMNQLKVDGYFNKVLYVLEGRLNFTTEHKVPKDRAYGSVDRNGTWNGMVGMLVRGEVDLVVGTLTMTSQRLDAVRFSVPLVSSTHAHKEREKMEWKRGDKQRLGGIAVTVGAARKSENHLGG
uniref:Ionotropic glutamate receptor L-glutamate and glycine-binding domain-containing protein n=1 Tax=Timema douglasi TaxID=61478 RepID=A0A7R8Z9C8_TIMDO|nr:unnamed protein product [Timema douglasi]